MPETQVPSLGGKNPREKEMAAHSSVLTWEIPRTEEPGGLQSMRTKESERTERLHFQEMKEGRPLGASVQRSRGRGHRFPAAHTL